MAGVDHFHQQKERRRHDHDVNSVSHDYHSEVAGVDHFHQQKERRRHDHDVNSVSHDYHSEVVLNDQGKKRDKKALQKNCGTELTHRN